MLETRLRASTVKRVEVTERTPFQSKLAPHPPVTVKKIRRPTCENHRISCMDNVENSVLVVASRSIARRRTAGNTRRKMLEYSPGRLLVPEEGAVAVRPTFGLDIRGG